jgi:pimeloyl-ACP methyl ester carboxylesterase
MQTFEANGTTFVGEERGTGELLILVHGAVGDYRTWEGVLPELAKHYRTVTYSRRWHHPNPVPANDGHYTQAAQAVDLAALIRALGGGPARLLAHSYGAAVCAELALAQPSLVRCLVLAEPSLFGLAMTDPAGAEAVAQTAAAAMHIVPLVRQGQPERALREFLYNVIGREGYERLSDRVRSVMLDNVHTLEPMLNGMNAGLAFSSQHAAQIRTPTLLVEGEYTTPLFRATIAGLARAIPGVEHRVLPGVSHGLHLEAPEVFTRAALEFLARH